MRPVFLPQHYPAYVKHGPHLHLALGWMVEPDTAGAWTPRAVTVDGLVPSGAQVFLPDALDIAYDLDHAAGTGRFAHDIR